jgi:hypothetical protein
MFVRSPLAFLLPSVNIDRILNKVDGSLHVLLQAALSLCLGTCGGGRSWASLQRRGIKEVHGLAKQVGAERGVV